MDRFATPHGFEPAERETTFREDATYNLRGMVADIAYESGFVPAISVASSVLRVEFEKVRRTGRHFRKADGEALVLAGWQHLANGVLDRIST
jgi:hypothetical protein